MKKNKSEVIIVLDRSGSMEGIKTDIEGGFKTFIDKQKKEPGECYVSLYQFDTEYEKVFENKDIQTIEKINLVPRGGTALLDALGRTINDVGERLSKTKEKDRPETIIILAISDGLENSSKEFTQIKIKNLIEHQTSKYNWHFVFLGSNQDAILTGKSYGVADGQSLSFANNYCAISGSCGILSDAVTYMRATNSSYKFSDEERVAAMVSEDSK